MFFDKMSKDGFGLTNAFGNSFRRKQHTFSSKGGTSLLGLWTKPKWTFLLKSTTYGLRSITTKRKFISSRNECAN